LVLSQEPQAGFFCALFVPRWYQGLYNASIGLCPLPGEFVAFENSPMPIRSRFQGRLALILGLAGFALTCPNQLQARQVFVDAGSTIFDLDFFGRRKFAGGGR
jgi:hypothetical protein